MAETVGLDRWLRKPYNFPSHEILYLGWDPMRYKIDEGDLWSGWFRPLALALIASRYPQDYTFDKNLVFRHSPTLGWHEPEKIKAMRGQFILSEKQH